MSKSTLICLVGLPGSGKDYWVENFLKTERGKEFTVVSTDSIIEQIAKESGKTYNEIFNDSFKEAEKRFNVEIDSLIAADKNVVWNQTNLGLKKRKKILSRFQKYNQKYAVVVTIDPDVHAERLRHRETTTGKRVSQKVIDDMRLNYSEPSIEEGFDSILILDNSTESEMTMVSFKNG